MHYAASAIMIAIVTLIFIASASTVAVAEGRSWKVVLTWGDGTLDLDLHVTVPLSGRGETLHVHGRNQDESDSEQGTVLFSEDVTPDGEKETVTIDDQGPGIFQFYVHDYSSRYSDDSYKLSDSGARVKVFEGSELRRTFDVPTDERGNLWTVFALHESEITPIDNMTLEEEPDKVGTTVLSALIPGDILFGRVDDSLVLGQWSHVGIYVGNGKIVEATDIGEPVNRRTYRAWEAPNMTWVKYMRVIPADRETREKAVQFSQEEYRERKPYNLAFYTKQRYGESWYCSELVWAAYMNASDGEIDLEHSPDFLGVYTWEIEDDDDTLEIGGHFESEPTRNFANVLFLSLKKIWDQTTDFSAIYEQRREVGIAGYPGLLVVVCICICPLLTLQGMKTLATL